MKRVVIMGVVVATAAITVAIGLVGLVPSMDDMPSRDFGQEPAKEPETFDQEPGTSDTRTTSYEKVQVASCEFEIPARWQFQPSDAFLDSMVYAMITEASNGRVYDHAYYEYAEPKSLETDLVPTTIQLSTATSDLTQDEYEGVMFEIASLIGSAAGMDLRLIDSRQDSLGGRPAVTLEYVLVDVAGSGLPTIKAVETTTAIGSTAYSISYVAELDDYDAFLHHFQNAVKTFKFK